MEGSNATPHVLQRLVSSRWLLVTSLVAIAVLGVSAGVDPVAIAGVSILVVAVAALAPRRVTRPLHAERDTDEARSSAIPISAEALAAAVDDPLVIFDRAGLLLHANGAFAVAFPGLAAGTPLTLRFRAPEMQEMIATALADGVAPGIDYAEKVPIERYYRVRISPVGAGDLFVMIFKDQSETRRIDRMRADFIANASHELRTPLASISGFIETLRGPARNDPAARDRFLEIMQAQTSRMARLIDDLLSLSKLEMKPYLDPGRVDLKPLMEGVIDALRPMAEESGVTIQVDLPASPLTVAGSRDELIEVFENLVENACKYGQSGGRVEVFATAAGPQGEIEVSVRDHGPGIAAEHIPRLTERFYRVDVGTGRAQRGTGLGLAIAKHILTRHKARLSIWSAPGEGAMFTVHFPSPD